MVPLFMNKIIFFISLLLLSFTQAHAEDFSCEKDKRSCGDYSSCSEAVYYTHVCGLDYLDIDNDGFPCEKVLCAHNPSSKTKFYRGLSVFAVIVSIILVFLIVRYLLIKITKKPEPIKQDENDIGNKLPKKAENKFIELANLSGWIVEKLPQDQENFEQYWRICERKVKRGDFICRNRGNIEIEVKCLTLYPDNKFIKCFYIGIEECEKLLNMQDVTKTNIYFAFFEKNRNNEIANSPLRMISLNEVKSFLDNYQENGEDLLSKNGDSYKIPLNLFKEGIISL
jgi:hypothetical protein